MEMRTVSTSEAATLLGISRQAVLKRIERGTLPAARIGRNYRIARHDLATRPSDPVLAEIARRLVRVYAPDRIYLFGSAARGDAGPDSDYDVLVVVSDDAPAHLLRGRAGHAEIVSLGVAVDVVVRTVSYFDARAHLKASLPGTVLREGTLLYAA
jgi:excisionase family DNA binding protein